MDVYRHGRPLPQAVLTICYFAPGVLALGEGDNAAEGLADGLGLVVGTLAVGLGEGDVAVDGLEVIGELESLTGSVAQPAANMIEHMVRRRTAVRLMMFTFAVLITFLPRSSKIEKRDDDCSSVNR